MQGQQRSKPHYRHRPKRAYTNWHVSLRVCHGIFSPEFGERAATAPIMAKSHRSLGSVRLPRQALPVKVFILSAYTSLCNADNAAGADHADSISQALPHTEQTNNSTHLLTETFSYTMDAIQTAPTDWSRQDILALLQLLTMILISIIGAFWHLIVVRPNHST
jgi:hypothetical protein